MKFFQFSIIIALVFVIFGCGPSQQENSEGKDVNSSSIDTSRVEEAAALMDSVVSSEILIDPITLDDAVKMYKEDSIRWAKSKSQNLYRGKTFRINKQVLLDILEKAKPDDRFYVEMGNKGNGYTIFVGIRKEDTLGQDTRKEMFSLTKATYNTKYNKNLRDKNKLKDSLGYEGFDPSKNFEGVLFDINNSKAWLNAQNGDTIFIYPTYNSSGEYSTVIFNNKFIDFKNSSLITTFTGNFGNKGTTCCQ
jgi:hypothetical protein